MDDRGVGGKCSKAVAFTKDTGWVLGRVLHCRRLNNG